MIFAKFYPADHISETGDLTLLEQGIHLSMLMYFYKTERPLPMGKPLYHLLRATKKSEQAAVERICKRFWLVFEGGFVNKRAQKEIEKYGEIRRVNSRIAIGREHKKRQAKMSTVRDIDRDQKSESEIRNDLHVSVDHSADTHTESHEPGKPTKQGEICVMLKTQGIVHGLSPSHPLLLELIEKGADVDDFLRGARAAAVKNVYDFRYVLTVVQRAMERKAKEKSIYAYEEDADVVQLA